MDDTTTTTRSFRLRRSRTDRMIGGVLGGLAADLDVDAVLLRVGLVALTILGGGIGIPLYVAAWLLAPEADGPDRPGPADRHQHSAAGGSPAGTKP